MAYFTDAQHFKIDSFIALPRGNAIVYNGTGKTPLERTSQISTQLLLSS